MEKRTLIALALSFLVLAGYPMILQKVYPDYYKKKAASPAPSAEKTADTAKSAVSGKTFLKAAEFASEADVTFRSEKLQLVFNKKDGGIREIALPAYADSETKAPIKFISLQKSGVSPGSLALMSGGDLSAVTDYEVSKNGDETIFTASALAGKVRVEKKVRFDKGYAGTLELTLENVSGSPLELQYELVAGSGVRSRHSIDSQYIESNFFSIVDEKKRLKHVKEDRLGRELQSEGSVQWTAVKDRHFSVVMKPVSGVFTGKVRGLGDHDMSASLLSSLIALPAGGLTRSEFTVNIAPHQ